VAKEYYVAHPDEFQSVGTIHVSHILINKSPEEGVGAFDYASSIRDRVLRGEDFAQLAKELSDDPSAEDNAGDLGVQPVSNLIPAFAKAALQLSEPGELSELVRTDYGYHIIKFHAKTEPRLLPWDEVKASLIKRSREKLVQQKTEGYIEALKADKNYQINDEVLNQFATERLRQLEEALDKMKQAELK
jgi:peptidyl-prolyl cis-trans isomerase C